MKGQGSNCGGNTTKIPQGKKICPRRLAPQLLHLRVKQDESATRRSTTATGWDGVRQGNENCITMQCEDRTRQGEA